MLVLTNSKSHEHNAWLGWCKKKWTVEFLSGHPLEMCQCVKKHLCWNFGQFGQKLEVATELQSFNGKMHSKQALFSTVGKMST